MQKNIKCFLNNPYGNESSCLEAVANSIQTTAVKISEFYFEVEANVSITGGHDPEQILSTWISKALPHPNMTVLDFQLLPKPHGYRHKNKQINTVAPYGGSRAGCVFQVQVVTSQSDPHDIENQIRQLLNKTYNDQNVNMSAEDHNIQISRILIVDCKPETHLTRKGLFVWLSTFGGKIVTHQCPKNPSLYATRNCKMRLNTHWMEPNLDDCHLVVETVSDLEDIEVTAENARDVAEMIESLLGEQSALGYGELSILLNKLKDIIHMTVVTPNLGQVLINIISKILESDSDFSPFTNTILNIIEAMGDTMVGYQLTSTLLAPAVAVSVLDVNREEFGRLTFGVSSDHAGLNPQIFINRFPFNSPVAFIALPSSLWYSFPQYSPSKTTSRIQFQFYAIPMLFKSNEKGQILNTFVVSASVSNATSPIKDLHEEVKVILYHLIPKTVSSDATQK
ncbi:uncharacterized protein LOC117517922 [Thalassophryne amazonica]|uniref:uncharacterized protein LOC117517922 n=1 Tax=Thalassophryne amazonica TaxID=390379 RepID=UPI0014718CB7|nr:uncharacterized protein LOC117517922 [Thalassophryne amazonica]